MNENKPMTEQERAEYEAFFSGEKPRTTPERVREINERNNLIKPRKVSKEEARRQVAEINELIDEVSEE